jgi:cysteinyl-tRNA synthetase
MLTIGEEKMSKSLKNFFTVQDILMKYRPEVVRFFVLNATYSSPLEYDEDSLEESRKALEKLNNAYDVALSALDKAKGDDDATKLCDEAWKKVEERLDDDFSSREAIAVMFDIARESNRLIGDGRLSRKGVENVLTIFRKFNGIFDVLEGKRAVAVKDSVQVGQLFPDPDTMTKDSLSDEKVNEWVQLRSAARTKRDFAYADKVRRKLSEFGIEVNDTKDGAVWKRK